jgi:S1-C subfamily serine protease
MRKLLIPAVLIATLATACAVDLGPKGASPGAADPLVQAPLPGGAKEPVEAVVRRVLPAVVNVTSDIFQQDATGNAQRGQGVGTGFIVRSDGVIVTNCHVVEQASKITVSTSSDNPDQYDARVIGGDCLNDVAVLKIDATDLPTVDLGSSGGLQLGQSVVALGYALALEGGPSVSTGIVSGLDRTITAADAGCTVCKNGARTYTGVIQTDAAINHGNSGGPLVDLQGQVVGINSAGDDSAQNIGFAIAIDSVKETVAQAEANPLAPVAYLGVSTQTVNGALATQFQLKTDAGAYVVATTADGPAASAGLKQGEVIVSVDGQTVAGAEDLGSVLAGLTPGQTVSVDLVTQDGTRRSIEVTLGTRPLPTTLP